MSRPTRLIAVVGTATEVGKTWVTARLCEELRRRGASVSARKPVQSFEADSADPTDGEVLAAATGDAPSRVCPDHRWYPVPMAPPMAADVLGLAAPSLVDLLGELWWPSPAVDVGFVETVGGTRSPVADDADSGQLAARLDPDAVLVVADAGLGVIDAVRCAAVAVADLPTLFFLNRFVHGEDLHRRNLAWLCDRDGLDVFTDLGRLATRLLDR